MPALDQFATTHQRSQESQRFCSVQPCRPSYICIADFSVRGEVDHKPAQVARSQPERRRGSNALSQHIARPATRSGLLKETSVTEALERCPRIPAVDSQEFPDTTVGEDLAPCRLYQQDAVCWPDVTPTLDLEDPRPLLRTYRPSHRERDLKCMSEVSEHRGIEERSRHLILHNIDPPPDVLSKPESTKRREDDGVSRGMGVPDILLGYGFEETARRDDHYTIGKDLNLDGLTDVLLASMGDSIGYGLAQDNFGDPWKLIAPKSGHDQVGAEFGHQQLCCSHNLVLDRTADLFTAIVLS